MLKNSYQSTALAGMHLSGVRMGVDKQIIQDLTQVISTDSGLVFGVLGTIADLPIFAHPLETDRLKAEYKRPSIACDLREYTRGSQDNLKVVSFTDHSQLMLRAKLELTFNQDSGYRDLYALSKLPMYVYSSWIANVLTTRLGLTPEHHMKLTVLCALYYYFMHTPVSLETDQDYAKIATRIGELTFVPVDRVIDIIKGIEYIKDLPALAAVISERLDTDRVKDLTAGTIISVAVSSSGWRGAHSREIVACALEHAPTWHAMVFLALESRSFIKTTISKTIKLYRDKDAQEQYNRNLSHLIK